MLLRALQVIAVLSSTTGAAWLVFVTGYTATAALDAMLISSPRGALSCRGHSVPTFVTQIIFWLFAAILFGLFVWQIYGSQEAESWLYGYILEYMLSVDNLFVFQLVFKAYSVPSGQVERALFWGVSTAVVLRLAFFGLGTQILSLGLWARLVFGFLLVYSGFKTLRSDGDEEDDPRQNPLVRCISTLLPIHPSYGDEPTFFIRVAKSQSDSVSGPPSTAIGKGSHCHGHDEESLSDDNEVAVSHPLSASRSSNANEGRCSSDPSASSSSAPRPEAPKRLKVTPLFLVVITLGVIDVVFAVDSVTAKISSVSAFSPEVNFFLNLTSSAFAMFVLRSLYVVIDMLGHMFRFLGYGVGLVLMFIGVKLMLSGYVELSMGLSFGLILSTLIGSMILSAVLPRNDDTDKSAVSDPPNQSCSAEGVPEVELTTPPQPGIRDGALE